MSYRAKYWEGKCLGVNARLGQCRGLNFMDIFLCVTIEDIHSDCLNMSEAHCTLINAFATTSRSEGSLVAEEQQGISLESVKSAWLLGM